MPQPGLSGCTGRVPDFRAFCPTIECQPASLKLSPEESHHLVVVNRARQGDVVMAFDGRGTEWTCKLAAAHKSGAVLSVCATRTLPPPPCALTLAQALPKGGVMEDIVRHATELGAGCIVPLETERTQVHLDSARSDRKIEKWRVTALEAAKQCGNPFLPEITDLQTLTAFLTSGTVVAAPLKLVASLHDSAQSLKTVLADFRLANGGHPPAGVVWLVGPEGDFSPAEMSAVRTAGFEPVTLGPLVLRCDTAATAALSILLFETSF